MVLPASAVPLKTSVASAVMRVMTGAAGAVVSMRIANGADGAPVRPLVVSVAVALKVSDAFGERCARVVEAPRATSVRRGTPDRADAEARQGDGGAGLRRAADFERRVTRDEIRGRGAGVVEDRREHWRGRSEQHVEGR